MMNFFRKLLSVIALVWVASSAAHAATEIWPVTDNVGTPQPGLQTVLGSPSSPNNNLAGGFTLTNLIYKFSTDNNGIVTYTNLFPGTYVAGVQLLSGWTYVKFTVTNFSSTNYITNNATVGTVSQGLSNSYPIIISDARYPSVAGSNVTFVYTNGRTTINVSGGSSVGGITNLTAGEGLAGGGTNASTTLTTNGQVITVANGGWGFANSNAVPSGSIYAGSSADPEWQGIIDDLNPAIQINGIQSNVVYKVTFKDGGGNGAGWILPDESEFGQPVVGPFYFVSYTNRIYLFNPTASLSVQTTINPVMTNDTYVSNLFVVGILDASLSTSNIIPGDLSITTLTVTPTNLTGGTGLVVGTGLLSTTSGSHLWTNSINAGFSANHQFQFFVLTNEQYNFYWINSNTAYSDRPAQFSHTNDGWKYYPNAASFNAFPAPFPAAQPQQYQSVIDTGGGVHIQGQDTANDGRFTIGSGTNVFSWTTTTSPNAYRLQCQGLTGTGYMAQSSPYTLITILNGAIPNFLFADTNGVAFNNFVKAASNAVEFSVNAAITNQASLGTNGIFYFQNGAASKAINATVAIVGTGATNSMGVNATAYVICTATTFTNFNNAGTAVLTNTTATFNNQMFNLQPGGFIKAASGLSGTLVPW